MTRDQAIAKIKKCLALSKSDNPHEAASALRQAQSLMEQFAVTDPDLLASDVTDARAKTNVTKTPPRFEAGLAGGIAKAFGCKAHFCCEPNLKTWTYEGSYQFLGCGAYPTVAAYTYTVLRRRLQVARSAYIKTSLKRCGPKNKTARADEYCAGWVYAVLRNITPIEPTPEQAAALTAYIAQQGPLSDLKTRQRSGTGANDAAVGYVAGRGEKVNQAVGGAAGRNLIGA